MPAGDPPLMLRDLADIKVRQLRGVGERTADRLLAVEITTVLDLIQHYPRRYLDRTRQAQIGELLPGDEATVLGTVRSTYNRKLRGRRTLTNVVIGDGTGKLTLVFFNQRWREKQLTEGMEVLVHGKFELFRGTRQMTSPVVDLLGNQTGRIIGVYPQSEKAGLTTLKLAELIEEALSPKPGEGLQRSSSAWKCLIGSILSIAKPRCTAFTTRPRWSKCKKPAADSCLTNSFECSWS